MMNMILPAVVVASSVGAYFLARRRLDVRPIAEAAQMLVDCIGVSVLFLAFNLIAGALTILFVRRVTFVFVSLYSLDSPILLVFSVAQGLVFRFLWPEDQ
jgi:hypothetical protein